MKLFIIGEKRLKELWFTKDNSYWDEIVDKEYNKLMKKDN
jgi:hypothetical protein